MNTDPTPNSGTNRIQAVGTTFQILHALQNRGWTGVSELAEDMDIPKSTVHVYLLSLHDEGYLRRKDGKYRLSLRFLELGGNIRQDFPIYQTARQYMDELSSETGEVANLGVEEDGKRVLMYTTQPPTGIFDNAPAGEHKPLHWTALGKALLAQLPDSRIIEIADEHGLPAATEKTITDVDELLDEIESVRQQGYAIEDEEQWERIKAIAVPIEHVSDPPLPAAVSIAGPKFRIDDGDRLDELLNELKNTVNIIELEYEHY